MIAAGWSACTRGEGPLVAFLGDSLTSGYRLPEEEAYPALVANALRARGRPIRVVNAGRSGDTVRQGLARLPAVLRLKPDVVVVALGTNDALRGLPLADAEAALDRIVRRLSGERRARAARGRPLPGLARGGTRPGRSTSSTRGSPPRGASRWCRISCEASPGSRELLMPDGLHPNAAGQQQLARNVTRDVELLLAELPR